MIFMFIIFNQNQEIRKSLNPRAFKLCGLRQLLLHQLLRQLHFIRRMNAEEDVQYLLSDARSNAPSAFRTIPPSPWRELAQVPVSQSLSPVSPSRACLFGQRMSGCHYSCTSHGWRYRHNSHHRLSSSHPLRTAAYAS